MIVTYSTTCYCEHNLSTWTSFCGYSESFLILPTLRNRNKNDSDSDSDDEVYIWLL